MRLKRAFITSITALSFLMISVQSSNAITSFSEFVIPEEQVSAIQSRFISLTNSISHLVDRTTFAREEFLRLRSETKVKGPEFQAVENFFRNQISLLHRKLSSESVIRGKSNQIFAKILKSSQTITQFIASRSMAILPSECAPAVALDGESIWEIGTVVRVVDGDTVDVQTCRGELNVRQLGIQAPETAKRTHVARCGGVQASEFMRMLLPVGSQVQLRSNNHAAANNSYALARPYRHIFAKDVEGSFTINVQAKLLETGLAMWFPNDNEFVGNYQYLELLNDAAKRGVGLWSGASCKNDRDKTPVGAIEMWVETDSPLPNENPFGEYVLLRNTTRADIDISEWSIRDTSLELFDSKYAFASGTILKSQETLTVYLGTALANFPLGPNEISLGLSHAILQNPSPVGAKYPGDGIYLQTPLLANGGGNMRAWSHRPCVPTDCPKPGWLIKNPDGAARATPSPQTLSIALNPQRFGLVVPDMTGLTEEQAKVALTPLRLNVIIFDRSNGAAGEKRVVEENPKSGAILPAGGAVTVNVDVQR